MPSPPMILKALGDAAWWVGFPGISGAAALARVRGLAKALEIGRPASVLDVTTSFETLAVHHKGTDGGKVKAWIEAARWSDHVPEGRTVEVPVVYGGVDGPDLEPVAERLGISAAEVVALHSGARYEVAAVGFSPGFPYLAGLPEALHLPRLATPRMQVAAGSVAIAGGQAGIYPDRSPGGWHLLGRTNLRLFDPAASPPSRLQPGDQMRFVPVAALDPMPAPQAPVWQAPENARWIEVVAPGAATTVQDFGRPGHEAAGVSPGGAIDRTAMRLANLLVGNPEDAPVLELCVSGPVLRFHDAAVVAVVNSGGRPRRVEAGETVDFSAFAGGVRACLAVSGGFAVAPVLGSAATDLRAGFGGHHGRALRTGDRLHLGPARTAPRPGDWHVGGMAPPREAEITLRFLPGIQAGWFSKTARARLATELFRISPRSDRMGARLEGPPLALETPRELISQPVACGSIQVPPDGQPIVLTAERQTLGGYPQIGHVISADLPMLVRAWPGTAVRFHEVGLDEAWAARRAVERDFDRLRIGLGFLK